MEIAERFSNEPARQVLLRRQLTIATVAVVTRAPQTACFPASNGIDHLLANPALVEALQTGRVGLLTHDACHTADGTPTRLAIARATGSPASSQTPRHGLVRLFTPEHGITASAPAGAAVDDTVDPQTGVPVISLYGPRFTPDTGMLDDLDSIVIDLRDVGVRCFTYAATAARLIAATASRSKLEILVCDRPNPLGHQRAGPPLDPALRSLVAWFDVPFVHGRTLGELLELAAVEAGATRLKVIACDPPVPPIVPVPDTAVWQPPSPALDHPQAVDLYPGLVLFEATNISEGRHTSAPFRSVAAPWLDTAALAAEIDRWRMPVSSTQTTLDPVSGRYAGASLPALIFTLLDSDAFDGLSFGVHLLCAIAEHHREFAWLRDADADADLSSPNADGGFLIDTLLGSRSLRQGMARGTDAATILAQWRTG